MTQPRVGYTWVVGVDVSAHVEPTFVYLFGSDCVFTPGLMTPLGEILANPSGRQRFALLRPINSTGKEYIGMDIPRDPALMGREIFLQAAIGGGKTELSNGLRIVIGF